MHAAQLRRLGTTVVDRLGGPVGVTWTPCPACAVVHASVAVLFGLAVATLSPAAGAATAFGLLVASHRSGYRVPGRPPRRAPVDVEAVLRAAWAVVDDGAAGDLVVAPAFGAAWRELVLAKSRRGTETAELARLAGLPADRLSLSWHGTALVARLDGRRFGEWESRPAFVADVAADALLARRYDGWTDLPLPERAAVLGGLRVFVERCPACDGAVVLHRVDARGRGPAVDIAATCRGCNARLVEVACDAAALRAGDGAA